MNIWLDDQIDDPATPERRPPEGYVGVKTTLAACRLIKSGRVRSIDFDHDLGEILGNGYIVARYIEKQAYLGKIPRISWNIHSANPVGRKNIELAMKSAEKFWDR